MFSRVYMLKNGSWENMVYVVYPLTLKTTLDETLDSGSISSWEYFPDLAPRWSKFKTVIRNSENDAQSEIVRYFYGADKCKAQRLVGPQKVWIHDWDFVEPTKILERVIITGQAITQPSEGSGYTLKDTVETVLKNNPVRRFSEPQLFKLTTDTAVVSRLNGVSSPEFAWTNRTTLFEVLHDIGKVVGGMPRLVPDSADDTKFNTVTFDFYDKLGETIEQMKILGETFDYNMDDYCTSIETVAENIVGEDDENEGSIVYPSKTGYITPRCGQEVKLSEENAILSLPYKIKKINKIIVYADLEARQLISQTGMSSETEILLSYSGEIDITDFVVTREKWGSLYDNYDSLKYDELQKSNTLVYEIGDKTIYNLGTKFGLAHWWQDTGRAYSIEYLFKSWHAINKTPIVWNVKEVLKGSYNENTYTTIKPTNLEKYPTKPTECKFRIEYIPYFDAKVCSARLSDSISGTTVYNQTAECVSARTLGENMWGELNGRNTTQRQAAAMLKNVNALHNVGDMIDGMICTGVSIVNDAVNNIGVTYELSKDFNRISEWIAQKRAYRNYNIPTDTIVDKDIHVGDFCVVSAMTLDELGALATYDEAKKEWTDTSTKYGEGVLLNSSAITDLGVTAFANEFYGSDSDNEINDAYFYPERYNQAAGGHIEMGLAEVGGGYANGVLESANSIAMGKSNIISFEMVDNFSAGKFIKDDEQIDAIYSDEGKFDCFTAKLGLSGLTIDGKALPYLVGTVESFNNALLEFCIDNNKDVGDRIRVAYQLHYEGKDDIIVGNALATGSAFIKAIKNNNLYVVLLNRKLSKYTNIISDDMRIYLPDSNDYRLPFYNSVTFIKRGGGNSALALLQGFNMPYRCEQVGAQSYAIVNQKGELLIGCNDTSKIPIITFKKSMFKI